MTVRIPPPKSEKYARTITFGPLEQRLAQASDSLDISIPDVVRMAVQEWFDRIDADPIAKRILEDKRLRSPLVIAGMLANGGLQMPETLEPPAPRPGSGVEVKGPPDRAEAPPSAVPLPPRQRPANDLTPIPRAGTLPPPMTAEQIARVSSTAPEDDAFAINLDLVPPTTPDVREDLTGGE